MDAHPILYRTVHGPVLELDGQRHLLEGVGWDDVFRRDDPRTWLTEQAAAVAPLDAHQPMPELLAPIAAQEVWAAGVTYYRSRSARMEESADAGGGDFYDRVYSAERPELFFKSTAHRCAGPGQSIAVRTDSRWNVPEPELTLCITARGALFGYTIGNDVSSRDIEGENPLYLPQAKVYFGSAALGPGILLTDEPLPPQTEIALQVERDGQTVFEGTTRLEQMKRTAEELIGYLFRHDSFPHGCFLMTGTGIVPPAEFTLKSGDTVRITIEPIGTLENTVA